MNIISGILCIVVAVLQRKGMYINYSIYRAYTGKCAGVSTFIQSIFDFTSDRYGLPWTI